MYLVQHDVHPDLSTAISPVESIVVLRFVFRLCLLLPLVNNHLRSLFMRHATYDAFIFDILPCALWCAGLYSKSGRFRSETAIDVSEVKLLQIYSGYMQRSFLEGHTRPPGCNGNVTAVAVGQRQQAAASFWCQVPGSLPDIISAPSKVVKFTKVSKLDLTYLK